MTAPFVRPTLEPASPAWILRTVATATVEIVFVGHANRADLDAQIERLARWPWGILDDDAHVTVLADTAANPIGVRIHNADDSALAERALGILVRLVPGAITTVATAIPVGR